MSRQLRAICDGCDRVETCDVAVGPANVRPVSIAVRGIEGRGDGWANYDLCPDCRKLLAKRIRPQDWARAGKPETNPPAQA